MQRVVQVLTILTLLALAPALAQGSQPSFKPTSSTLVLPVGQELSDAELSQIEGKWVNFLIGVGVSVAAGYIERSISGEPTTVRDVLRDAAIGVASGVVGGAAGRLSKAAGDNLWHVPRNDGSLVGGAASGLAGGAASGVANRLEKNK
ncbi:hypothetical protein [Meiothermus ruber]|jgi:hypothetical protein|uniref:hypothetical protein n=1 Tax=Meiothermus ruber TaxID=277 RepID=UPI0012E00BE6|nr:hypothetical protein [Meiothermus ruber]MCL6529515.1 hypothetical protein [Meiothermus ruber]